MTLIFHYEAIKLNHNHQETDETPLAKIQNHPNLPQTQTNHNRKQRTFRTEAKFSACSISEKYRFHLTQSHSKDEEEEEEEEDKLLLLSLVPPFALQRQNKAEFLGCLVEITESLGLLI